MGKLTFYIVDVFAEEKFAGNQLAVFRGAKLSLEQMQSIAREMHFSETTFIMSEEKRNGGYDVLIFTPSAEVPFAGHPTLGTAHVIRSEIETDAPQEVILNLKVGPIPVTFEKEKNSTIGWMKQIKPEFGKIIDANIIADVLRLNIDEFDHRFPVEEVSTGLPHIIVPLRTLISLKRAHVDKEKYFNLIKNTVGETDFDFLPRITSGIR